MSEELININGIREDLYQAMQIGDITLKPKIGQELYDFMNYQDKEIERLNKKIEQYENPEDMTLMFMWCDEKAKDEIKRLNNIIKVKDEGFKASTEDLCETTEELEKANNIINKMNDYLVMNIANGSLDFMYRQGFKDCYEKLIELKGSDKN